MPTKVIIAQWNKTVKLLFFSDFIFNRIISQFFVYYMHRTKSLPERRGDILMFQNGATTRWVCGKKGEPSIGHAQYQFASLSSAVFNRIKFYLRPQCRAAEHEACDMKIQFMERRCRWMMTWEKEAHRQHQRLQFLQPFETNRTKKNVIFRNNIIQKFPAFLLRSGCLQIASVWNWNGIERGCLAVFVCEWTCCFRCTKFMGWKKSAPFSE